MLETLLMVPPTGEIEINHVCFNYLSGISLKTW